MSLGRYLAKNRWWQINEHRITRMFHIILLIVFMIACTTALFLLQKEKLQLVLKPLFKPLEKMHAPGVNEQF